MTKVMKGFKVRIYPTQEQEQHMWQHIGACRFIWNYMLDLQKERYENGEKYLSAFSMINLLKPLKNDGEHGWLYEVSNKSLQCICQDLDNAYQRLFKHISRWPKYKSRKKSKPNYPISSERFYFKDERYVRIQKIGEVKYKTDFDIPFGRDNKFYNARVSYVNHKWFVSFSMECENQVAVLTDKVMGIDLGIKELAVVALDGEQIVYHNINKSSKIKSLEHKKKLLQRSISRKYEQNKNGNKYVKTNNIVKLEDKMRKIYAHLTGIRNNYIHQITHALVSMLSKRVVMEDLDVTNMMKSILVRQYSNRSFMSSSDKCVINVSGTE